jgi:hypothetical protein
MTTQERINKDPFAYLAAKKLHEQLLPLIRAIEKVRRCDPEFAEELRHRFEPTFCAKAKKWEKLYFNQLSKLRHAGHNATDFNGFIAAQIKFPRLRKLYEKRRISAVLASLFRSLL